MTRGANVRPGTVTAAQVIISILAVLGAVGAGPMLVVGVLGLVSGVSVAASGAGSEASGLAGAFGGLISMFSGAIVVAAVISLAFVGLWIWIAVALGRASRAARVVLTVFCALDGVWGLLAVVVALTEQEAAPLLVCCAAARDPRHADGPALGLGECAPGSSTACSAVLAMPIARYAPAPMSPPVGVPRPRMAQPRFPEGATAHSPSVHALPDLPVRDAARLGAVRHLPRVQPPRPVGA